MRHATIDGVPVFWVDGPPPLSAELLFGTGMRDESFPRAGITHLVEHLVMSTLQRRHHYHNAGVSIGSTSFAATGRPESVRAFLHDVCAAIRDLPVGRLETERKVLSAEQGGAAPGLLNRHLLLRYGLRGPGLAGASPPALDQLGAEDVRDWAARELLGSNAALALSGPPPDGLRLQLPDGPLPPRPPVDPLRMRGPVWDFHEAGRGVALSLLVPDGQPAMVAATVLRHRVTDELRHRLGLAYDVADVVLAVDADRGQLAVMADPAGRDAAAAAVSLDRAVRELRDYGPTVTELADDLAGYREDAADPRMGAVSAATAALQHLRFGRDWDPAGELAERESVTARDVQAALAGYAASAILTVPPGVDLRLPGFERKPDNAGGELTGRAFRRRPFGPMPSGTSLVVGDDGMALRLRERAVTIRWPDLVGYGVHDDGRRTLYGGYGTALDLHPSHFLAGRHAIALVEARVPAEVRFAEPG